MPSKSSKRVKSWLGKFRKSNQTSKTEKFSEGLHSEETQNVAEILTPVEKYYYARIEKDLDAFYNFAIQSQSLVVRDVLTRYATNRQYNFSDFLSLLEAHRQNKVARPEIEGFASGFDKEALLVIAALLSNTARDDLDIYASVQIYDFVYDVFGKTTFSYQHRLQYVEALLESSQYAKLEHRLDELQVSSFDPLQAELLNVQRSVRVSTSDQAWVDALNEIYGSLGMSKFQLIQDESLPLLDRLTSSADERIDGPKVSVIMPTYSPGPGIRTAIRSLLEQTWSNLEIIVVDDASPEEFEAIFSEIEALDPRIHVVRQVHNAGSYVARNAGLTVATGEFITTHDDDDWSHPDKIAEQVNVLIQDNSVVATVSAHIRTSTDMRFQRVNKRPVYTQTNYSSLMFRRSLVAEIGSWDTVTRSGDTEFLVRIMSNFGSSRIVEIADKPMSFSRVWKGSLTSGEMWRGFYAPSRLLYRGAFLQWHRRAAKEKGKIVLENDPSRPFPTPTTFAPGQRRKDLGLFDVIYVTDYFTHARFSNAVVGEIEALISKGYRVGYMHLSSPESRKTIGLLPQDLLDFQLEGKVTQVSHDDAATTKLLIVYDAAVGMFLDGLESTVSAQRSVVICHEPIALLGTEERSAVLLRQALKHLDNFFATSFKTVGATPGIHERLEHQIPSGRKLPERLVWHIPLPEDAGQVVVPQDVPRVGFHSYGNQYRWPATRSMFESAYISSDFRTRLYGNVQPAKQKFGPEAFESIEVISPKQLDETEFLHTIDFWVYLPHERLRDQVWRPVLRAMQAGKVVILPKRLEPLYGSAALYENPENISALVGRLSNDAEAYRVQARRGQEFVATNYSIDNFFRRIGTLTRPIGEHAAIADS